MATIINIHSAPAAKRRGIALAAFLAAERATGNPKIAERLSAEAVGRFQRGECSPAMAVARAKADALAMQTGGAA